MVILTVEAPRPWAGLQGRDRPLRGAAAVWAASPSAAGEEKGSGDRGAGEGCCQLISLARPRTDSCAGNLSGALGFDVKPLQPCHFCIHPLPPTMSSITEKKWSLK